MIIKVPIYVELAPGLHPSEVTFLVDLISEHFAKDLRKKKIPSVFKVKVDKEIYDIVTDAKVVTKERAFEFLRKGR